MYKRSLYANEYVKFINYSDIIEKGKLKVEDKSHTIEFRMYPLNIHHQMNMF